MNLPLRQQRGAALITAIFLLLMFAGLSAWMLELTASQQTQLAQDVQGSRALQAARAGMEYGFYQVLTPSTAPAVCPTFTPLTVEGFTVTVNCSLSTFSENDISSSTNATLSLYEITATASYGIFGSPYYVERSLRNQVCRDDKTSKKICAW